MGRIRHRADLMHHSYTSNLGGAITSNYRVAADGLGGVVWSAAETGGSVSYGSNSNDVSNVGAVGASTLVSRVDHVHRSPVYFDASRARLTSGTTTIAQIASATKGEVYMEDGFVEIVSDGGWIKLAPNNYVAGGGNTEKVYIEGGHGLVLPALAADPAAGASEEGQLYRNSTAGTLKVYLSGAWRTINADDPIEAIFGAPDTRYEFSTTSLTGLTALSPTPDVENADTTVPDCYYVMDNASTLAWCGRYIAFPSTPFTVIAKLQACNFRANFSRACLFIGETTPGNMDVLAFGIAAHNIVLERQTPTAHTSTVATSTTQDHETPFWLGIRANSTTSLDYLYSWDGWIWTPLVTARNPALTLGSLGIAVKSENSGGAAGAFDFLRIWNSALTFPGV